jgi:hypothetical protein
MSKRTEKRPRIKRKVLVASSREVVDKLFCTNVQDNVSLSQKSETNKYESTERTVTAKRGAIQSDDRGCEKTAD